jgi:CrcB protein
MTLVVVSIAGAFGALFRYVVSGWVQERTGSSFPVGTLAVNLSGAFLLGLIAGGGDIDSVAVIAGMGLLGGFTTFSTWMVETVRMGLLPLHARAIANVTVLAVLGPALAVIGYSVGS